MEGDSSERCLICDREMRRATAFDLNGLIWSDKHQAWKCPLHIQLEGGLNLGIPLNDE